VILFGVVLAIYICLLFKCVIPNSNGFLAIRKIKEGYEDPVKQLEFSTGKLCPPLRATELHTEQHSLAHRLLFLNMVVPVSAFGNGQREYYLFRIKECNCIFS